MPPKNPVKNLENSKYSSTFSYEKPLLSLSRKSYANTLLMGGMPKELAEDLRELCLEIVPRGFVAAMEV